MTVVGSQVFTHLHKSCLWYKEKHPLTSLISRAAVLLLLTKTKTLKIVSLKLTWNEIETEANKVEVL